MLLTANVASTTGHEKRLQALKLRIHDPNETAIAIPRPTKPNVLLYP